MKKLLTIIALTLTALLLVACEDKKPLTPIIPDEPTEEPIEETPIEETPNEETPIEETPNEDGVEDKEDEIEDRVINYISGDKFDKEYFTIDVAGYNTLELTDLTLLQSANSYINVTDVKVDDKLEDLTVLGATSGTSYLDENTAGNLHMTNYKVIIDTYNPLGALRLRVSDNSGTLRIDVSTFSKIEFNLASNASTNKVTANIKLTK